MRRSKKRTITLTTPNTTPLSDENITTSEGNKNEEKTPEIDIIMLKDPALPADANNKMRQRTIDRATAVVIVNNRITTLITLRLRPTKGSTILNVLKSHKNIFSAMKFIEPRLKLIAFQNEIIYTSDQFSSFAAEYTYNFEEFYKCSKSSRVYISHKIESAIPLGDIKHGNRQQLSIIYDALVSNNAYLNLNKFSKHIEHSIGFFTQINPKVTLRDNFRNKNKDEVMWID